MSAFLTDAAWGVGVATVAPDGTVLDVWFTRLGLGEAPTGVAAPEIDRENPTGTRSKGVSVLVKSLAEEPVDTADVYLRLHLLSHRFVTPHTIDLSGIFGLLPNNAWTNHGPVPADSVNAARLKLRGEGQTLEVKSLDKFPPMADYVTPVGVRIADASRVRLGAHLAEGTTVMHEGFVNFNAGTLGNSMVEGRISAGVVVGDGSDIGGGSSIMGTLSGGGKEVISIGERCLLGANAGIGISLGDNCVVAAGCYVTAGSKVTLPDGTVVKAATLSGKDNLQFWTNTQTGVLEVRPRTGTWGELNAALHSAQ
ncbi:DapH/DapD/GlmU-related protein [Glycomyces artemisiae]|uniref:2,3,4,5-tetrahydropyridine-2,6-dicarboxylate N-succinyltransferase n=1 Tax=Glycomyces artemisiae TaxID=1076443 RepID=A0A2T0UJ32_9ACTN|nr:DapH/DapD/GlmU-related protein [Glycomyces artemisiae]PRY57876.1 2,3,4,5-tetrahydropyridine-2-carboxylate N-succinyltransferase [Glycomyces artemisiae]